MQLQSFLGTSPTLADREKQEECRHLTREWWHRADMLECWPLGATDVVALLRDGAQYDVDEKQLKALVACGMLEVPEAWTPADVVALAGALEARQQWRPAPSIHDPKKHVAKLIWEQAAITGEERAVANEATRGFDLRGALRLMSLADHRETRERLHVLVQILLAKRGIRL